jgi:hypothetical protein
MAVKFTKPEINVREKLAELDKPSGIAGEAMLRAETPQEQFNLIGAGRRNLLINGSMIVAQRGTSFGPSVNVYYGLDRWKTSRYAATNFLVTQEDNSYSGEFASPHFIRVQRQAGDTSANALSLHQKIESQTSKLTRGREVTLSFWYRTGVDYTAKVLRADINGTTSTGSISYWSYTTGGFLKTLSLEPTNNVWKKATLTYQVPNTVNELAVVFGWEYPNVPSGTAGSNEYFDIAETQLELGKVATPFEHRSYGEELALCQRYYQRITGGGYSWITEVQRHNSTGFRSVLHLPVPLRVVPSISYSNLAYWYNNGSLSAGTQSLGVGYTATGRTDISHLNLEYTPTSMGLTTDGNLSAMLSFTSAGGYLAFSSEL